MTALAAIVGMTDDRSDAMIMLVFAALAILIGTLGYRAFSRAPRPPTSKVLTGLVVTWITLVLAGVGVYLATGSVDTVDQALLESAAGFSTTSLTILDPTDLSTGMQLWRASTQWLGGLFGLVIGVIILPRALRSSSLIGRAGFADRTGQHAKPAVLRRRVIILYSAFTTLTAIAYVASGLSPLDGVVHSFTTVSTGGFSSRADSFVGFGGPTRVVATVAMLVAGSSFFVMWWIIRGRVRNLLLSSELRVYVVVVALTTVLLSQSGADMTVGESLFTVASTISTTGYAIGDWTTRPDYVLAVLLVVVAMGSMAGSAGGGLRILRVHTLMKSVIRELRMQLDPHRVSVIKNSGHTVEEASIDRVSGYHIAYLLVCSVGAFVISISGVDLVDSIWIAVGTLSGFGPAPGIGPFGYLGEITPWARLALIPMMLAARVSVLVVLLGFVWLSGLKKSVIAAKRHRVTVTRR